MKQSLKTGFSYGWTSEVTTTFGLMVGLHAGTHSRLTGTGGIVPIAGAPVVPHEQTLKILAEEQWERSDVSDATPHQGRRHAMRCTRCGGLMVLEGFEDLIGLGSGDHEYTGWRCINCGAIVDPLGAEHQRLTSVAGSSI